MKKEEIKKILSLHWQRLLTDEEAYNKIEREITDINAAKLEKVSPDIRNRVKTRIHNIIDDIINKNKESNGRYIHRRIRLFTIEELVEDLSNEEENIEIYVNVKGG